MSQVVRCDDYHTWSQSHEGVICPCECLGLHQIWTKSRDAALDMHTLKRLDLIACKLLLIKFIKIERIRCKSLMFDNSAVSSNARVTLYWDLL